MLLAGAGRLGPRVHAADQWIEVKSAHFVVTSNAGAGNAKALAWQLEQIRTLNRNAEAYASLGEVRSLLGTGESLSMVLRAISLEPSESRHHLRAAGVLWRERKYDEALKHAQAGLRLAKDDGSRRRATEMVDGITRATRR
ncbi:MAG TPA: hypothetical protein VF921_12925 [Vicinamibacterales bacterium]